MKKLFVGLCVAFLFFGAWCQKKNQTYLDYITKYKDIAVKEMQNYGIPASITMSQGLLESSAGTSTLTKESNNHFGIKCQKNWTGDKVYFDDDEQGECFRKYDNALDSYEDHSKFLKNNARYSSLFILSKTDYKGWAAGLKNAGYATNPAYADRLIQLIETYHLDSLDRIGKVVALKETMANAKIEKNQKKDSGIKDWFMNIGNPDESKQDSATRALNQVYDEGKSIGEVTPYRTHEVQKINNVKCVVAMMGDSYKSIAEEFGMFEHELQNNNEVQYGAKLTPGDLVFLAKKHSESKVEDTYIVKPGETLYQISQRTGVKVRTLYRLNNIVYGKQVKAGDTIKLK